MFDQRNLKQDLLALGLLAVALFFGAALLSYDPADPPSDVVYPPNDHVHNACGPLGALAARCMLGGLGIGAYYGVLSLGVLTGVLLARREINEPLVRLCGWLMTLAGMSTLSSLLLADLAPGPVIGAGGYLGAAGAGLLQTYVATAGAVILVLSMICCGLFLCTDYMLLQITRWSVQVSAGGAARFVRARREAKSRVDEAEDEEWEEEEEEWEEEEETTPAVKIRKAGGKSSDEEEEEESEDAPSMGSRLASALRIRNRGSRRTERDEVLAQIEAASSNDEEGEYELPSIELLMDTEPFSFEEQEKEVRRRAKMLEKTFASFGFSVRVVEIETGPVIAQFEVELEAGLRLSKITSLSDDLAVALRVPSVRIVAPIPGKNTVGIEVPNTDRQLVRLREVMEESDSQAGKMRIPIYMGKDVSGNPMVVDMTTLPHLLIAGRTGTGKSVCLNTLIMSMLMTRRPDEVKLLLIDPKMVELTPYARLPHLMHPVVTDMKKAEAILAWAVEKMEERYTMLMRAGVRHIDTYNQLGEEELLERMQPETDEEAAQIPRHLPYIIMVADEIADLMMTAPKEVESHIIRLAQKSRAVGIHLVLATQKPTVDVITGLIKSNLPARVSFQVASRTDSRVVLDEMGADKLLGNGDMLFLWPGTSTLHRGQGCYVSDDEIRDVVNFLATTEPQFATELIELQVGDKSDGEAGLNRNRDDLYEAAVDIVVREGRGSVSLLQRSLGIGYGRAARLIDYMAEDGIVGSYNGSQARDVLITVEEWTQMQGGEDQPSKPARNKNKVVLAQPRPLDEDAEEYEEEEYEEAEGEDDEYEEEDAEYEEEEDEYEDDEYEEDEYEEEDEYSESA